MKLFDRLASMLGKKPVLDTAPAIVVQVHTVTAPAAPAVETRRVRPNNPTIAIVNKSSVLKDEEIFPVVVALQIQVDRDFAPVWNLGANLVFVPTGKAIPEGAWVLYLLDHSDQQGALGYHDITSTGAPTGKIFAADDKKYNLSWTVTLSHELLEMLLDPYITQTVFVQQTNTTGLLFAYEVCDAVEDDSFGYMINNVLVSDFVYPAWFEAFRTKNSTQFSYGKHVTSPFEIGTGGYIGYFQVSSSATGWQQATGSTGPGRRLMSKLARPESRLHKRDTDNFHNIKPLNKLKIK